MTITFFGHASTPPSAELERKIMELLQKRIGEEKAELFLGNCGNFDRLAYECGKKYRNEHSSTSLIFVTPYIITDSRKAPLICHANGYDSILYPPIENRPRKYAIIYRNRFMAEKADLIIAYINHCSGGAYQACRYAKGKGKSIYNLGEKEI